jgi:UPF0755 protein
MRKLVTIFLPIFILLVFFVFIKTGNSPVSSNKTSREFIINKGEGLVSIAKNLQENSLIRNQYLFLWDVYTSGQKNKIQAGKYRLSQNLSTPEIIKKLTTGGTSDYWLKIIEGQRVEEITPRFSRSYEGYLFPDSYLIPDYYTPEQILKMIEDNFTKKFAEAKEGSNSKLSDQEIIILASLLEREARSLEAKKMVAGILLNRLEIGMGLQVDATIQYLRDTLKKPKEYWTPITSNDIAIVSPYNTYKNRGLPPGPICSPGYDSIFAAFHPTESNYMFYITGNDNQMHYAQTLSQHTANINKYLKSQ